MTGTHRAPSKTAHLCFPFSESTIPPKLIVRRVTAHRKMSTGVILGNIRPEHCLPVSLAIRGSLRRRDQWEADNAMQNKND